MRLSGRPRARARPGAGPAGAAVIERAGPGHRDVVDARVASRYHRVRRCCVLAVVLLAGVPRAAAAGGSGPCTTPPDGAPGLVLNRDLGGGRRLCVRADPGVLLDEGDGRILELPDGTGLSIAVIAGRASRWLRVERRDGATLYEWRIDSRRFPFDDAARAWTEEALAATARIREGDAIRAEAERLRAEIDALVESERRLRDEISAVLEERGRLQREIGRVEAEERDLRTRIAALRGEESALRVAAGDHRAAIASLTAALEDAAAERRDEIEEELGRRQAALEAVEARLRREDHAGRIEELQARLGRLDTAARVTAIESRIAELRVDDRVGELEEQAGRLQVRERSAALRKRLEYARERLEDLHRRLEPRLERLQPAGTSASPPGEPP